MSITSALNRVDSTADGVQTSFNFSFPVYTISDLLVYVTAPGGSPVLKTYITDYTQSAANVPGGTQGGTVTFNVAPTNTYQVTLLRSVPNNQPTVLTNLDKFDAKTSIEASFDRGVMQTQQIAETLSRALQWPVNETGLTNVLPDPALAANQGQYLQITSSGIQAATPSIANFSNPLTTKGDLIVSQGGVTPVRLPIGTDKFVLTADSGQTSGMGWEDPSSLTPIVNLLNFQKAAINPIINANMDIWQRGTSFTGISAQSSYTADRWRITQIGTSSVLTVQQSSNVPAIGNAGILFNSSLEVDCTTADTSLIANENVYLRYGIEGHDWRPFAQRQFTVGFWAFSTLTGVYTFSLSNSGADRYFATEFTVNSASTWEYKTITVPASVSTGTWGYLTGMGLVMAWVLASGPTDKTAVVLNSWQSGSYSPGNATSSNQVNFVGSTSNIFRITGVTMGLGATVAPIAYRTFAEELDACLRYYQKSFQYGSTPGDNVNTGAAMSHLAGKAGATAQFSDWIYYNKPLRTNVNPTFFNPSAGTAGQARDLTATADCTATSISTNSEAGFRYGFTGNASTAVGNVIAVHWTADAEL